MPAENIANNPQALVVIPETSPLEQALADARVTIEKIKVAMVKIYYIFAKEEIQKGLAQVPDVIKSALKTGVDVIVSVIQKIMAGMKVVHDSAYVLVALLKELPNMVDAVSDLLEPDTARSAKRTATIAALTAVFVDEKYQDVQLMLDLFAKLLGVVGGKIDKTYKPGVTLGLTQAQLGYDPAEGPVLALVAPAPAPAPAP